MSDSASGLLRRVVSLPQTTKGRFSVYLCILFFVLFAAFLFYMELRPMERPTLFYDPLAGVLLLSTAVSGIFGGLLGGVALTDGRERSVLVFISLLVGGFVLFWTIAEIIGH